jgi:endoglucanase
VSHCLNSHNYARWNGGIIGQGGPTNDQFASLWAQLAQKYKSDSRVAFDLVNEPHDLDLNLWVQTNNAVVAAIRGAGCSNNMILLAGKDFASAGAFKWNSGPTMLGVKNPDGSTDNLVSASNSQG